MKDKLNIFLEKYPWFLCLLSVFFVLHGFTENYDFVPLKDAALLIGVYLTSSLIFLLIFRVFYKNWLKAGIITSFLMAFHLFFGSTHDGLKNILPGTLITKYIFILPVSFCLFVLIIILLKKRKKPLLQFACYLNVLFAFLIMVDLVWLAGKSIGEKKVVNGLSKEFILCNTCIKPDVYIIISDEYAGNTELKDIFHFDNTPFLNQLSDRGFHVIPNSSSNYNFTPYSIASTLNMDYLDLQIHGKQPLLTYTYETTRNNQLLKFLQYHHYKFYNYSLIDFKGHPAQIQETFLPAKTKLITSQTFLSRLNKDIRFNLITRFKSKREIRRFVYGIKNNNENLLDLTLSTAQEKTRRPKFILTHLMMPHYPYYFDKDGNEFPFEQLVEGNQHNQHNYIEYLQYCNKKLLGLVDQVLKNSSSPPVIILMGDHGFRHFKTPVDLKYRFTNLMAIYLPGLNYSAFTDSLTNVNVLRAVLNTEFNQHLPYLKDTTIIMDNP
jgi:hypothetical protein